MEGQAKNILVVTDEAESSREGALAVVAALFGHNIKTLKACEFQGTDILGSDVVFLVCADVHPASFKYLEVLFKHINLILRKCGVFTLEAGRGAEVIAYLKNLVKDSDIKTREGVFSSVEGVGDWACEVAL